MRAFVDGAGVRIVWLPDKRGNPNAPLRTVRVDVSAPRRTTALRPGRAHRRALAGLGRARRRRWAPHPLDERRERRPNARPLARLSTQMQHSPTDARGRRHYYRRWQLAGAQARVVPSSADASELPIRSAEGTGTEPDLALFVSHSRASLLATHGPSEPGQLIPVAGPCSDGRRVSGTGPGRQRVQAPGSGRSLAKPSAPLRHHGPASDAVRHDPSVDERPQHAHETFAGGGE